MFFVFVCSHWFKIQSIIFHEFFSSHVWMWTCPSCQEMWKIICALQSLFSSVHLWIWRHRLRRSKVTLIGSWELQWVWHQQNWCSRAQRWSKDVLTEHFPHAGQTNSTRPLNANVLASSYRINICWGQNYRSRFIFIYQINQSKSLSFILTELRRGFTVQSHDQPGPGVTWQHLSTVRQLQISR